MRLPWQKQEKPAVPPGAEVVIGHSVPIDRLQADMLREYVRSIYLWRSVDMIGSMAASIPLIVVPDRQRMLSKDELDIQTLLTRPNPQWTGAALQYFLAACLALANKAYLLRVNGTGNRALELWPLQPNEVTIKYQTNSRVISGFTVSSGGSTRDYPVNPETGESDLIYMRRPAVSTQSDKSPAAVAAAPAEVFTRILQRCADIVSNSSNITGLLSTEQEIAEGALQKIKDKITQFRTGSTESGGTLVTANAKWNLVRLSEDPASALSVEIKDSLARDVVMTFGVPTQLVGLPGTDTYNNLAMARVGFLTDTVLPGYTTISVTALNHALMSKMGSAIKPDLERLPAMIAARLALTQTAAQATMLSVNEQRALLGYPAYDDDAANVPVLLEELNLKRLAIEVQGGNVANILAPSSR